MDTRATNVFQSSNEKQTLHLVHHMAPSLIYQFQDSDVLKLDSSAEFHEISGLGFGLVIGLRVIQPTNEQPAKRM